MGMLTCLIYASHLLSETMPRMVKLILVSSGNVHADVADYFIRFF